MHKAKATPMILMILMLGKVAKLQPSDRKLSMSNPRKSTTHDEDDGDDDGGGGDDDVNIDEYCQRLG